MKHTLIIAALLAAASSTAFATKAEVGNCIMPKNDHVKVFFNPESGDYSVNTVGFLKMRVFSVVKVAKGGYVQIMTVPNYDQPDPNAGAGQIVGWVRAKEFIQQDLRNCN